MFAEAPAIQIIWRGEVFQVSNRTGKLSAGILVNRINVAFTNAAEKTTASPKLHNVLAQMAHTDWMVHGSWLHKAGRAR